MFLGRSMYPGMTNYGFNGPIVPPIGKQPGPPGNMAFWNQPMGMPPAWSTPPILPTQRGGFPMMGAGGTQAVGKPPPPPPPKGPKWLQKITGGMDKFAGMMAGPVNPMLDPQAQQAVQQQQRMAMIGTLLANSGPRPVGTQGALEPFGRAMQASALAGNEASEQAMRAQLLQLQMQQANQPAAPHPDIERMKQFGYPLTQEGWKQYNADQGTRGTTINVGEAELDKPIPIAQLDTVRLPDGTTPPLGTTMRQAREMGAKVLSAEDQKRTQQADQALGILGQLESLAIGPNGVFNEVEPGLANRVYSAIDFGLDMLEQKDPRASQFADMSKATLAPFIKFLGETGSLAQGDVERALGLVPRIFPLPDTGEVAKEKLDALREIITRGVQNMNSVKRQTEQIPPLPPGFTLDPTEEE